MGHKKRWAMGMDICLERQTRWGLICLLWIALGGCGSSARIWEENKELAAGVWLNEEALRFHFIITDSTKRHRLWLRTRYDDRYPYHNMYVSYKVSDLTGGTLAEDIHEFQLFDPASGRPLGSGSVPALMKEESLLLLPLLPARGRYCLELQQFMRIDSLRGVLSIGIRVGYGKEAEH